MAEKILILHIPVVHRGFLDFLKRVSDNVSAVYVIDDNFLNELSENKPDIASFDAITVKNILAKLDFKDIFILSKSNLRDVKGKEIILVKDEISRNLAEQYLTGAKIEWQSVFLRWDRSSVLVEKPPENIAVSKDAFDVEMIGEARKEAEQAGEWWRQIGAVLLKDKKIILRGWNKDLPSEYTPYQVGEVRDFFKTGERQDLASTIHAEQNIIAQAAKTGISLEGTSLYVTTFPCPVCAKMIAWSGIKNLYFQEGGSNFDAQKVLVSAGVQITCVP